LLSDRPEFGEFSGRTYAQIAQEIIQTFFKVGLSAGKTVKTIHSRYGILKFRLQKSDPALMVFDKNDDFKYSRHRNVRGKTFRWSTDGLRKWLRNPVLRGHTAYRTRLPNSGNSVPQDQWDIRYNTHSIQRLLTDEQGREIDEAIALNKRIKGFGHKGNLNTFVGILTCASCGRNMRCQTVKSYGEKYYQCRNYTEESSCTAKKMVRESVVMKAVIEQLTRRAQHLAEIATTPQEIIEPPEVQQWRQQLEGLNRLGHNSAFDEAKQKIQNDIDKWWIGEKAKYCTQNTSRDLIIEYFSNPQTWEKLDKNVQQEVVRTLVSNIKSVNGKVTFVVLKV